jgi:hypothetical protein
LAAVDPESDSDFIPSDVSSDTSVQVDDNSSSSDTEHGSTGPVITRRRGRARTRGQGRRGRAGRPVYRRDIITDQPPIGWTDALPTLHIREYTEVPKPKCDLPFDAGALEYLLKLTGDDFFANLVVATYMNAVVKMPPENPDDDDPYLTSDILWEATNEEELKAFISINILMGIDDKSEYTDYWSEDTALHNAYISSKMTRSRFEKLCQYFHCSNPAEPIDADDKLHKVRPLVTVLKENFHRMFVPGRDLSVDEAMIKFDGRLGWKQYMPKKPIKWGIKLWCLCDSKTGYCLAFNVYTGADGNEEVRQLGLAYSVVMELLRNHLFSYHHVFADNFFSSFDLVEDLNQADTYYCGTVRINRKGLPQQIQKVSLQKNESVKWSSTRNTAIMVSRWKDKRDVFMISSNNDGSDTHKPRSNFRQNEVISIPTVITEYNKFMGGVDHFDQFRSYYNVGRSGRRWWKYLFWGLLNISIVNAYILWHVSNMPHNRNKRNYSLKKFKLMLVHELADMFTSRKRGTPMASDKTRKVAAVIQRNVIAGHSIIQFQGRKRICIVCKNAGRKTAGNHAIQTIFGCSGCNMNMCKPCFREHHNL